MKYLWLLCGALLLPACHPQPDGNASPLATAESPTPAPWPGAPVATAAAPVATANGDIWLLTASSNGLELRDSNHQLRDQIAGQFEQLSLAPRASANGPAFVAVTSDQRLQQLVLWQVELPSGRLQEKLRWPVVNRSIEALCFYQSARNDQLSLYLLDDRGGGEQWLVAEGPRWLATPLVQRNLNLPDDITACAADPATGSLYLAEGDLAIWRYGGEAEESMKRKLVALGAPHGPLNGEIRALAMAADGALWAATGGDQPRLYRLLGTADDKRPPIPLSGDVEGMAFSHRGTTADLAIAYETAPVAHLQLTVPARAIPVEAIPEVAPLAETAATTMQGDVMDDPAIWINRHQPEASQILGTDKRGGLEVYDLAGNRRQRLAVGRINNVDLRYNLKVGERQIDIAAASQRDNNSLALFAIDPATGVVTAIGEIATPLDAIYGLCMYQPAGEQKHEIIVNDKDGRVLQYRLDGTTGSIAATLVREFKLASQPEGCVADDQRHRLFIGEEDRGIWVMSADAEVAAEPQLIAEVNDHLVADVEGMAIAEGPQPLLVVSSQGNDSYLLYQAEPPYRELGRFRIGINRQLAIDGASETDGLEVTTTPLGDGLPAGLMVVQDGHNYMPKEGQNFKLVSWAEVLATLEAVH